MDRWIDGQVDRWIDGQMDRWKNGQMARWLDGQMVRWLDGQMDRWIDGQMDRYRWIDRQTNRKTNKYSKMFRMNRISLGYTLSISRIRFWSRPSKPLFFSQYQSLHRSVSQCSSHIYIVKAWQIQGGHCLPSEIEKWENLYRKAVNQNTPDDCRRSSCLACLHRILEGYSFKKQSFLVGNEAANHPPLPTTTMSPCL